MDGVVDIDNERLFFSIKRTLKNLEGKDLVSTRSEESTLSPFARSEQVDEGYPILVESTEIGLGLTLG